jgi:DNA-directed RNA polymerase subunit RPC12/RpoP
MIRMVLIHCRDCGKTLSESAERCPHCGAKQSVKKKLDHTLVLIISIFLGWLGVDRFMMGHIGWGLLKLFTFGGFFVWWIIDIVLVATKNVPGVEFE